MTGYICGVNLLPSTGEFTYDTIAYLGQRATETSLSSINRYANGGPLAGTGSKTDYSIAIDNLHAEAPGCTTVAVVVAWFGSSIDATACKIYPSTTYINGTFQQAGGDADHWRCSGLTQSSSGLIAIPQVGGSFIYGGTPSDQSIVRCIADLKARGFRTVLYPFVLMTDASESWRGEITYHGSDHFKRRDGGDRWLSRHGNRSAVLARYDESHRRLFRRRDGLHLSADDPALRQPLRCRGRRRSLLLGSEFRGLETVRGPAWTKAGTTGGDGR